MADAPVELLDPFQAWGEAVFRARWSPDGSAPRDVLARVGPELAPEALERARERATNALQLRTPGLLPLLAVERVQGRGAWIYEPTDGVALALILEDRGPPTLKAAAELVARLADHITAAGSHHPGPSIDDVLVHADGTVQLAGFSSPFPRTPTQREPGGADDASAQVWRLGVVLAHLASGSPPPPVTDPTQHTSVLRRMLIRTMSRPGPVIPDRYRDWLTGMLAWKSQDRPVLGRVADGLRQASANLPEHNLEAWASRTVPAVLHRLETGDPIRVPEPPLDAAGTLDPRLAETADRTEERTQEPRKPVDLPDQDDETAISTDGAQPRKPGLSEHGTIPVGVGPPPEGLPRAARLPEELFAEAPTDVVERGPPRVGWSPVLVGLSVVLLVVAGLLFLYLAG